MIKISNVTKNYGDQNVLNNLNLELEEVGLVAIRGESGSGKTTLLNCLSGLDSFSSGTVTGIEKGDVSFIFQDFQLIDNLTVKENLLVVTDNKSNEIEEVLKKVNVNYPNKKVNQLSGGQKQRVALARALLLNTKYIFADEPTGNLDSETGESIVKLLKELSLNHLVFVVTHNVELFSKYCDRLITLKDGKVIADIRNSDNKLEEKNIVKQKREVNLNFKKLLMLRKINRAKNVGLKAFNIIFTFILSLVIFLATNIFINTRSDSLYQAVKEYNLSFVNFEYRGDNIDFPTSVFLSDERIEKATKKLDHYAISYPGFGFYIDGESQYSIEKINVTNYVNTKLECGKNELNDGEIILSQAAADWIEPYILGITLQDEGKTTRDYTKLLNRTINVGKMDLTIVGVDKKINIVTVSGVDKGNFENYDSYAYINENTFKRNYFPQNFASYEVTLQTEKGNENIQFDVRASDEIEVSLGRLPANENEIVLSKWTATEIFGSDANLNDVLNKEIEVGTKMNHVIELTDYEWLKKTKVKIVGISSSIYSENYASEKTIENLYYVSDTYCNLIRFRELVVFDRDLSSRNIDQLNNNHLADYMFLSQSIDSGVSMAKTIGGILIIVALPLLFLLILFQFLYAKQLLISFKRIIGILKSQLMENKKIIKIFLFDLMLINVGSIGCAMILSPFLIKIVNNVLISKHFAGSSIILYRPVILIILLALTCLTTLISLFITFVRLNKKSDVDLVYER